eukprot:COSAG02_NODE_6692_length_3418_cov_7.585116_1_plen_28_part_10
MWLWRRAKRGGGPGDDGGGGLDGGRSAM